MTNPDWWRVEDVNGTNCTNSEMKEAIESVLFVDMQSATLANINYVIMRMLVYSQSNDCFNFI